MKDSKEELSASASQPGSRKAKGIVAGILGVVFLIAGSFFIIFPMRGLVFHHDPETGRDFTVWVSKEGSRVYGFIGVFLGATFIWLARWPRWGAKRSAVEDYYWDLSQQLSQHFGTQKYYSVEEVTRIAGKSGFNMAFIAYAHAMYCSRTDFDGYYTPLHVACTYDGLRAVISRRYFDGARDFDAATIVRLATPPREEEY